MHVRVIGTILILVSGLLAGPVQAGDEARSTPTSGEARQLLRSFSQAYRPRDVETRVEAIRVLGRSDHPRIAAQLMKLQKSKRNAPEIQAALFEALAVQRQARRKVVKQVAAWLRTEAKAMRKRFCGSTPGFRVDPRTGDPDLTSEEGLLVLEETKARGAVLREAVLCLRKLSTEPPKDAEKLKVFLHHPHDGLVAETLAAIGKWELRDAMPELLELYRMYPTRCTYDTSIWQAAARLNEQHARATYTMRFGHPDKRRSRPEVYRALHACLESLTDRRFKNPDDLARWMQSSGGERPD